MGQVDLDRDGLVYSTWGTGCCYAVRVWRITPAGVGKIFEAHSREAPSLITSPRLALVTFVRPTDGAGRQTSTSGLPVRWTYRRGRSTQARH